MDMMNVYKSAILIIRVIYVEKEISIAGKVHK